MFGKRKVAPAAPAAYHPASPHPTGPVTERSAAPVQSFTIEEADPARQVVVRRSALEAVQADPDAYELVGAVVDFVNAMFSHGYFLRDEMVPSALQAYHADYYLAQVNNGGHSQFIHNCGANAPYVWHDASVGLHAMGAGDHAVLLERMIDWAEGHPDEAGEQTGFDGARATELDELDDTFYALEKSTPMIRLSSRWILGWPELRIVEDDEYEPAINHLAFMNPLRGERVIAGRIRSFEHQINDWLHAATGMVAATAPESEMRLHIGGGSVMAVEGEQCMIWNVNTSRGRRFAHVTEKGARLYECVEADNPTMPDLDDTDGMIEALRDGRMARFRPPLVGPCLNHVEADQIAETIQYGNRFHAAAAFDLMLRQVGEEDESVAVSAVGATRDDDGVTTAKWLLAAGNGPFLAVVTERGAKLIRSGETMATVSVRADDILAHAEAHSG